MYGSRVWVDFDLSTLLQAAGGLLVVLIVAAVVVGLLLGKGKDDDDGPPRSATPISPPERPRGHYVWVDEAKDEPVLDRPGRQIEVIAARADRVRRP